MEDIKKIVKSLKVSDLLIKGTIENILKEWKSRFFGMLLGTLIANLLGNMLTGHEPTAKSGEGQGLVTVGETTTATSWGAQETITADYSKY